MTGNSYVPGTWHGIVRSRTAVLLGPDTPPELVHSLWELLESGPEVHELLHAVTSSFGVSLAQIPPFGIVDFNDSLRVFLRGDIDLTVQLAAGPVELHGRDVTTWAERNLAAPEWYRISVPGSAGPGSLVPGSDTAAPALPLQEGVVLLQSLTVGLDGTAEAAAATPFVSAVPVPAAPVPIAAVPAAAAPATVPAALATEPGTTVALDPEPAVFEEPAPAHEVVAQSAPDSTFANDAPEHGASAETVIGVMDEDFEDLPAEQQDSAQAEDAVLQAVDAASPAEEEPTPDAAVPVSEQTSTYDHLWERTVVRSIEDAAVRDEPDGLLSEHPAQQTSAASDAGETPSAADPAQTPAAGNMLSTEAPAPAPAHALAPSGGLIDSVPWNTGGGMSSQPGPGSDDRGGRGEVARGEAVRDDGDHDGQTIMKSDLAGMAEHPAPPAVAGTDAAGSAGPMVLARVCAQGHANPPTHAQCAVCGQPLPSDAVQVSRPRLGRMRVSSGELVDLDQSLVIGRQPSVSRVQGGVMPRLVQVASPSGDISRSHVQVRLEGWHVMLCDLKATNGTVLVREGQQPRRLAQNEMAILLDGDIAELGDGISLRFEEIL